MYLFVLAAIALAPLVAIAAVLALILVRVDCYGGIRVLGWQLDARGRQGPMPLAAAGAVLRVFG